ncbi:STAS domain-containing protein [Streptomyces sp. ISL-98]|uniref:STAS domain-containing protein n=1 Tax=Streptomyces sp. ISL-98 TaxID=2819192 RepID=UPI001BEA741A|nr:STAS domain-containing protein [Streptomyces sp. ISL-98]MBT2509387.1 STAS domain-containing protein [Streptomyces sp. ISL-98]
MLRLPPPRRPHRPGTVVVRLRGQIDACSVEPTSRTLLDALGTSPTILDVDLSGVEHLSADGTGAFFAGLKAARSRGTRLTVTHAPPQVAKMLNRVGLLRLLSPDEGHDTTDS